MSSDYTRRVIELFEIGLDDEQSIGLHGTSLDAIIHLCENGRLPNTGRLPDKFYFFPLDESYNPKEMEKAAGSYSEWNAKMHFIRQNLPFEPRPDDITDLTLDYAVTKGSLLDRQLRKHNLKERDLLRLIDKFIGLRSKGVLISLASDLRRDFQVIAEDSDERYIVIPGGLPIKYITGIEPLGQYEWGKFIEIQKKGSL